jgi:hypothetical protein
VATLTNAGMWRRLGMQSPPPAALTLKHILLDKQFRAQQITNSLIGVVEIGLKRSFNFTMIMSLFLCRNTGNNFPFLQEWVQFSCTSRLKPILHQTHKPTLYYHIIALPVYNHFFGSYNLSVCENYTAKQVHLFSSAILMDADGQVGASATPTFILC